MPPAQETNPHSKRPNLGRHLSESSYIAQSPTEGTGPSSSFKAGAHKPQKHVVGRLGRNVSFGKNLHKLGAHTSSTALESDGHESHQHKRSTSGGVESAPSSPRPGFKRNASSALMKRNTSHTALRKNLSSGHLPRQGSAKNLTKHGRTDAPKMKRTSSDKGRQQRHSPPPKTIHPTVHFDVGDEDGQEDGWTEDSASQSPEITRANTRMNSVVAGPGESMDGSRESRPEHRREPSDLVVRFAQPSSSPPHSAQQHSIGESPVATQDYANGAHPVNRQNPSVPWPPDADMITSRLLQRASQNAAAPQTTMVSASGHADAANSRSLGHSQGSTLGSADTQGKGLVSRFINGSGSLGNTPRDSNFLPIRQRDSEAQAGERKEADISAVKRNKSVPNMAHPLSAAASAGAHRRNNSGSQQTPSALVNPELNPSRTQQKLWLQRASSTIEPQKMIPSVLPKTVGPPLLGPGVNYAVDSAGRLDPRLQRQFDQVQLEYKAIRRYRNPLAEALRKLDQLEGPRKDWVASGNSYVTATSFRTPDTQRGGTRTPASVTQPGLHSGRASTVGSARNSGAVTPALSQTDRDRDKQELSSRRSRVSFEVPGRNDQDEDDEDEEDERNSVESPDEPPLSRHRDDAYDICRRLWDMPAAGEGG